MKNILLIATLMFVIVMSHGPGPYSRDGGKDGMCNSCPEGCRCSDGFTCSSCKDSSRSLSTNCKGCASGYIWSETSKRCLLASSFNTCPADCICTTGTTCSSCSDVNKDFNTGCALCKNGYEMVPYATACTAMPCTVTCKTCTGSTCTECTDPNADPSKNCIKCKTDFRKNPFNEVCEYPCTCGCTCTSAGGCDSCLDPGRDPATKCSTCLANYELSKERDRDGKPRCVLKCATGCTCKTYNGCDACKEPNFVITNGACTTCATGYKKIAGKCFKI